MLQIDISDYVHAIIRTCNVWPHQKNKNLPLADFGRYSQQGGCRRRHAYGCPKRSIAPNLAVGQCCCVSVGYEFLTAPPSSVVCTPAQSNYASSVYKVAACYTFVSYSAKRSIASSLRSSRFCRRPLHFSWCHQAEQSARECSLTNLRDCPLGLHDDSGCADAAPSSPAPR